MAHRRVRQEERAMTSEVEMAVCEPPAVLPAQISEGARRDADTSGPRALMLAVLEGAVRCIEQGRRRRHFHARRLAAEADAWVHCDRRGWPFSSPGGHGRSAAPSTCTTRPQNSSRVIDSSSARFSLRATVRRPPGVSQMAMACEGTPPTKTTVEPTIVAGPT